MLTFWSCRTKIKEIRANGDLKVKLNFSSSSSLVLTLLCFGKLFPFISHKWSSRRLHCSWLNPLRLYQPLQYYYDIRNLNIYTLRQCLRFVFLLISNWDKYFLTSIGSSGYLQDNTYESLLHDMFFPITPLPVKILSYI